jgi:integrase
VRLEGLKIVRARGKYYVYRRSDGVKLVSGFEGDKAALEKHLAQPGVLGAFNAGRGKAVYAEKTLGWLVQWFTDPERCEYFKTQLSDTTREEYKDRLFYLEHSFHAPLNTIDQPGLYAARDKCSQEKWPAFADKMITALSTMFTLAVQRGWMAANPALGIKRAYKSDPNANREWLPEEWQTVMERAPLALRIAYMLARHIGYRSQSIVAVQWSHYKADDRFGKCFRFQHRKNGESHWIPASPALQDFLAGLTRTSPNISVRKNGQPWRSAYALQKRSSAFLTKLAKDGIVGKGLTEHGLRATFAAEIKRITGANDDQVAAALGDRDARMGAHYTRHVEQENKIIYLFATKQWNGQKANGTKPDLENNRAQVFQKPKKTSKINAKKRKAGP